MFRHTCLSIGCLALASAGLLLPTTNGQQPPAPPRFDSPMLGAAPASHQQLIAPPGNEPAMGESYGYASDPVGGPPTGWPDATATANPPWLSDAKEFEPSQIIAWVGDQPIQAGDLMPQVEQTMASILEKVPPEQRASQAAMLETHRERLMQQALDRAIEYKLLYLDFLRTIPEDKRKEALPQITLRAEEQFREKQLPEAMEKAEARSPAELDVMLRGFGTSLEQQKRAFIEKILGQSVLGQKIDFEPEVTHQQMLDFYHEHEQDYLVPARVRWEKLTVRIDRFPNKAEAWAALGQMGNEVLRGASLAAVARRQSQGVDASDGGQHDWTTQGSLASDTLDAALFSLPIGKLSERLEDDKGFHIVRVIEREGDSKIPFLEAQVDIKESLRKESVREQIAEYVAELKEGIPVWTAYEDAADTVR